MKNLRERILEHKPLVVLPAVDAFCAKEAYNAGAEAIWIGSFELSTRLGIEDSYILGATDMFYSIFNIRKSLGDKIHIIVDADNGYGGLKSVENAFRGFNILGVDLAFIENKKTGIDKVNSLESSVEYKNQLESFDKLKRKLQIAKEVQKQFNKTMVGIRIENLVMGQNIKKVVNLILEIEKYEPDIILIHEKLSNPNRLFEVADAYNKISGSIPLAAVTTTYGRNVSKEDLFQHGFKILIYPNHHIRREYSYSKNDYYTLLNDKTAGGALDDLISSPLELLKRKK